MGGGGRVEKGAPDDPESFIGAATSFYSPILQKQHVQTSNTLLPREPVFLWFFPTAAWAQVHFPGPHPVTRRPHGSFTDFV